MRFHTKVTFCYDKIHENITGNLECFIVWSYDLDAKKGQHQTTQKYQGVVL